jgi:hypothetical protein
MRYEDRIIILKGIRDLLDDAIDMHETKMYSQEGREFVVALYEQADKNIEIAKEFLNTLEPWDAL